MGMTNEGSLPAHQLLDFDWKLKYAVSSSSVATMRKPLLRVELCISTTPIEQPNSIANQNKDDPIILLSEYNKVQLDNLIAEMEAIQKALDESPDN